MIKYTGHGLHYGKKQWSFKVFGKKTYAVGFWFIHEIPF